MTTETSSASNVRRIEAVSGTAAANLFRERTESLRRIAELVRAPEAEAVRGVERLAERVKEAGQEVLRRARPGRSRRAGGQGGRDRWRARGGGAGAGKRAQGAAALSDTVRQKLGDAVVVLGTAGDERVSLVAQVAPAVAERGVRAGEVIREAAEVVGGGGGGRDTMAQAGGREPEKLPEALATARAAIERALGRMTGRVLALDHGSARCGCAVSDPSGTLATPLSAVARPDEEAGLDALAALAAEREVERIVVGLPITLAGEEGEQARAARAFADALRERVDVPVEMHDERLTTRMAERSGGGADADSRAAAHLLESWLAAQGQRA